MLGYMGPDGTFTQQAAIEWSGGREELREFPTIASAIKAVDTGEIERCIVPIENSLNGSVTLTLDTLAFDADVYITDEHILRIAQNLMIKKGADISGIKTIISHPQALGQCSRMLERDFAGVELKAAESTAKAAKIAAESDGSVAAITSEVTASLYGLEIARAACNDDTNNFTRFAVIEKHRSLEVSGHDKTSIVFSTEHAPGCLYRALGVFAAENINMLKIESRPVKSEAGKYVFFIDIEGNTDDARVYFALENVRENSMFYKFLGSYRRREI
ncbi:MAG TPA: prephenate dehydratase [Candidatus Ornithomonoglobus merdipullorum]|uniref:Prephenate dehydratase n=1 Tax=Candidatus Ornithomonoglobus merdipullorum TaxID=2840895 RepID=A0A9D1SEE3_9FIRM|nr:prephenate dehydratase [Candidatus Ornithomonoglobus merdipullorum]